MILKRIFPSSLLTTALVLTASCSQIKSNNDSAFTAMPVTEHTTAISNYSDSSKVTIENSESSIGMPTIDTSISSKDNSVDIENAVKSINIIENEQVKKWINYFSVKDKERFQRFLNRGLVYKEVVQTILRENDLPQELYYLALIESGYVTHAKSHASAVGVWQFIRGTAKRYGLEVNYYLDERRDPVSATEAAAKYLHDLYNAFNSWELAMASYNCGEYKVLGSIMRGNTRSFWSLVDKKLLPRETRNYVPKFMAAVIIGENPEKYGFDAPYNDYEYPDLERVFVPSPVKLSSISKLTKISHKELKAVNPQLRLGITPPTSSKYELWIPSAHVKNVEGSYERLATVKVRKNLKNIFYGKPHIYVVRRNDNLSSIANRFKVSISYIKKINKISGTRIYAGQKLRVSAKRYTKRPGKRYIVRSGDSLIRISKKFNVSISSIKQNNRIRKNRIYKGQRLYIPARNKSSLGNVYFARSGDSLFSIAVRFNTTVAKLKKINRIRKNRIYKGQKIYIKL